MKRTVYLLAAAALVAVMAIGAACSSSNDEEEPTATEAATEVMAPQIPVVDIGATEYQFDVAASIAGGLTDLHLVNNGGEDHVAELLKLDDGKTKDDLDAILASAASEDAVEEVGTLIGGPGAGPGGTADTILDLDAGNYVLLCFVPDANGTPHFALGMEQELEVTEPPAEQPEPPVADVQVGLSDFAFDAPDTIDAGPTTFEVTNNGPQLHEMALVKLAEGVTLEDAMAALTSTEPPPEGAAPPFEIVGADVPMSVGKTGYVTTDLTPGTYVMLCFVTDPESGAPHAALGMTKEITVQ